MAPALSAFSSLATRALPFLLSSMLSMQSTPAAELAPKEVVTPLGDHGPRIGTYSDRTLAVGLEVDRASFRLIGFTPKLRPFTRPLEEEPVRLQVDGSSVQFEVVLLGPAGLRLTQRADVGPLCFAHGPETESHVRGDTIVRHQEAFVIEVPEVGGFDTLEVAYHAIAGGRMERRSLGTAKLGPARFLPVGGPLSYSDLHIAEPTDPAPPAAPRASNVRWPEDVGDPDLYRIYGDPAEGDRRINVVIVPDGYRLPEKALMETHADALVNRLRSRTPFAEHDPFINYTLVYAYSVESGTDECDCDRTVNTAMGTRFPVRVVQCAHFANRCLYYGEYCDSDGTDNIVEAELRAPYHDSTVVMVNTLRYGACGGQRAVYSAGLPLFEEAAVHELGHSLGGLADEYGGTPDCGNRAGEVNTSLDPVEGAWPEWIADLGPPWEGAEYFDFCVYRPTENCEMRAINEEYCPVCNQQWALVTFGHPQVEPTAPVEWISPAPHTPAWIDQPTDFSVGTRFSTGAAITNVITWVLSGPGIPEPTTVASDVTEYSHVFTQEGTFTLTVEVVADTNFVKPSQYGSNRDLVTWTVEAMELQIPPEVSPPGAVTPLQFADRETLAWEDGAAAGCVSYNLYRGALALLATGSYGSCFQQGIQDTHASVEEDPTSGTGWFFLVSGQNPAGEGPLGTDSSGAPRASEAPCEN